MIYYYYLCIYNEKSDSNVVSMSVYRRTYEFSKQFLGHDVCLVFFMTCNVLDHLVQ